MKRYRTERWSTKIEEFEVVRETAKSVVFMEAVWRLSGPNKMRESKALKQTEYHQWHDTWAEAHAYLIGRCEESLRWALKAVKEKDRELVAVRAMTEPHAEDC